MVADIARSVDPTLLMRDIGFEPDPWQRRALISKAKRLLLLASRQSGKSTVVSCIANHEALYKPGSLTLLLAPVERQAGELFRKVLYAYHKLGRPVPARRELSLELELENGSRIVALPGKEANIRSYSSVTLAVIDEAARVPDELIMGVSPMLAMSQGRLMMATTPFGRRGVFFDTWDSDDQTWERIRAVAAECSRYSPEFLEGERRLLGPRYFAQEYESVFVDAEGQLFSTESIDQVFCDTDSGLIIRGF